MPKFENFIGTVSPSWAYKREAWRQELDYIKKSYYDSGSGGRLNANWRASIQSAEMEDRTSREVIRARARDLERNSDVAGGIISAYKRNVIGKGFTLQADSGDDAMNNIIENYWREWCKSRNCDVTEQQSFSQLLRMAVVRKKVDGGILFKKCYIDGGIIPFKLQAIEVDELDATCIAPKSKGNKVVSGIEYNKYNKPVGFWIRQYDVDGMSMNEPLYVESKDIIFVYSKRRPSQIREISDMAPTISRVRDINEFMTAVSVKERIAACLSVFIKKISPSGSPGRGIKQDNQNSYNGKTIAPGMIRELSPGEDVSVVNPSGTAAEADALIKTQMRMAASGQGLSYEAAARDLSQTNYSSARQGSIEDEDTFFEEKELIMQLMDEVYETFLICLYLTGVVNPIKFWDRKREYMKHKWVASPKKWIDPLKEANANKIALQTGQRTFKQVCAENGMDWKDVIDDMAEIAQYGKEKGIDLGGIIYGQNVSKKETGNENE